MARVEPQDPGALLPLTPVVLHILLALADAERHGYAVAQEVERQTDGKMKMGPGTLYGSIQRMQSSGLIEDAARRPHPADDERRRYYRLTALGRQVLRLELERLARVLAVARGKAVLREPEPA